MNCIKVTTHFLWLRFAVQHRSRITRCVAAKPATGKVPLLKWHSSKRRNSSQDRSCFRLLTAVLIIHSPMGKRSGAHFNPAITLTYLRLGKIGLWDAVFYVLFQFLGGVFGVAVAAAIFGNSLSKPAIEYAVTVPGRYGTLAAFFAELFMAIVLMTVVLLLSNRAHLAIYVSYSVGVLIALYTFFFAPISGFSINPARTAGSAFFANVWTAGWLYFVAPLLGMFTAAEIYLHIAGDDHVLCAKLHPNSAFACPFLCHFPGHRHKHHPHEDDNGPLAHGTNTQ